MGNRFFRARRNTIEERYTRPQRLLRQPSNVDYKKLRKLILSHKLAPCFDGLEDSNSNSDLEECPICFFFYPSLNRSRCCSKGICTECFLQMNPSNAIRPAQCPFCKSSSYAVEFRGARTQEEKGLEQAEEQKVIEAKIRMQYQESQPTEQVTSTNQHLCPVEVQFPTEGAAVQHANEGWTQDVANSNLPSLGRGIEASQFPFPNALNERHAEFGLNLDEVMLMEAIWQSIQHRTPPQFPESYGAVSGSQLETFGSSPGFPCFTAITQQETPNCQASSTTEVDSFHASQVSDDDMLKEEEEEEEMDVDNDTSSCSSVHTISDISNESPHHCCDIYGHQREYGPNASLGHQREYSGYQ